MTRRPPPATSRQRKRGPAGASRASVTATATTAPRHGLARVLSKLGVCSRTEAARWISEGRVSVAARVVHDPEYPIRADQQSSITVDGQPLAGPARCYLMLNKPRGVVTTVRDEQGRDTVYRCFDGAGLPWIAPVGRLDKASEGLLLFSNDPQWAAAVTDPATGPDKTYHVQIDCRPSAEQLAQLRAGVVDPDPEGDGALLRAKHVGVLREGERNAWLEIVLDEGRNRQIRRLLAALEIGVLRLVRVAIGALAMGELGKGAWRMLSAEEVRALTAAPASAPDAR
ncbi:pseudouridine synthase [Xanthomonas hortorum]|uniref:Pseudouridine synthase n=1 Tax=Xanthomonas hortorum pv. gardneri TaxID=2754056 RepID=A0A6V7EBD2_9XANT|nr:pseudouridine synthase [Xanthomonas hortorum]MCC4627253.1 rRNA pseudouridine synthase [Xanthomonas campestris pv. nigromaculans]APP79699.1 pseudouridylate synthase [Xanthomonas hortorum pv. gardneri]KLA96780.1 pseudouridylate synthase [Xanthomonas hortorum pv. gardneri]KLB00574.1 pseudouridylate synthase [Xanthomonas hortorum pv. gardneri]KLB03773.1 pseudouridylate synthase [Xanthomonas hortorum pv. gardneri]